MRGSLERPKGRVPRSNSFERVFQRWEALEAGMLKLRWGVTPRAHGRVSSACLPRSSSEARRMARTTTSALSHPGYTNLLSAFEPPYRVPWLRSCTFKGHRWRFFKGHR